MKSTTHNESERKKDEREKKNVWKKKLTMNASCNPLLMAFQHMSVHMLHTLGHPRTPAAKILHRIFSMLG